MTYEWAITRQVRWLILLLLVILIAILVIDVRSSERWMSLKEGYWTGDRVVLALGRRDREAGVMLVWQIQMHRLRAELDRAIQVSKGVCNRTIVDPADPAPAIARVVDCARANGIPVPPLNPSWPYEAWRATLKIVCERQSPACPWWRRVLSNVGVVTW